MKIFTASSKRLLFFAKDSYHYCSRSSLSHKSLRHFSVKPANIAKELQNILSDEDDTRIVTDEDDLQKFNTDWTGQFPGQSRLAVQPATTRGVSKILSYCNAHGIKVVPQGGNTGLVGGGTSIKPDELVMSMSRMNKILRFSHESGVVDCEAGCVLDNVNAYLAPHGYVFPLDLGSSSSCEIGGSIATNAGGLRFIRYGSLKGNVLGMEAVLADGTVLDMMSGLYKDNTGYDLKQLFIGSEGTLGVITKVAVAAAIRPASRSVLLLDLACFEAIPKCIHMAKQVLGETLSAAEYWDQDCMSLLERQQTSPFHLLLESGTCNMEEGNGDMLSLYEKLFSTGLAENGILASSEAQAAEIFKLRETITVALRSSPGWVFKYDVSLPTVQKLNECTEHVRRGLSDLYPDARVFQFGHVGDCNLHLNVLAPGFNTGLKQHIEQMLYGYLKSVGGSISAEHGLGQLKRDAIEYSKKPAVVNQMIRIKQLFDPNGIMNPDKVLPLKGRQP